MCCGRQVEEADLPEGFRAMYDAAVRLWLRVRGKCRAGSMGIYWAYHQRFFASLCMSAKMPTAVGLAMRALDAGKCVVIGLQSTGESMAELQPSRLPAAAGGSMRESGEATSTADGILRSFITKYCSSDDKKNGDDEMDCRAALLQELDVLKLPPNPLDDFIDRMGGPDKVAEMTGRQHRWVRSRIGVMEYVPRRRDGASADSINIAERQAFQEGRKLVAIISQVDNTREHDRARPFCTRLKRRISFCWFLHTLAASS